MGVGAAAGSEACPRSPGFARRHGATRPGRWKAQERPFLFPEF